MPTPSRERAASGRPAGGDAAGAVAMIVLGVGFTPACSTAVTASPGSPSSPDSPKVAPSAASGPRTFTVTALGYSLPGRTSTGLPVGTGVVAVDPSVIALGTRLTIPGYGEGVAADTGSAVKGNVIDLWFPTLADALAWGRRTVTITLH